MKKLLVAVLLSITSLLAQAQVGPTLGDWQIQVVNANGYSTTSQFVTTAKDGSMQMILSNGTFPVARKMGTSFVCSSTVCDVPVTTGATGATGATGPTGVTGPAGVAGATGAVGAAGTTGATGATGAAGSAGATGATGPAGTTTFSGLSGVPTTLAGYGITDGVTTTTYTSGLAGKMEVPSGTTLQYLRGDGSLATFPVTAAPSQATAVRVLNTGFQISTTRSAMVFYSVQMTVTANISSGQDANLYLEIASDSGFTTNLQVLAQSPCSQTYTLAVALQGIQKCPLSVSGWVPVSYYARLRTANTTGTPVFTYLAGQEVQF